MGATEYEKPEKFFNPLVATFITGGARLLLAMFEKCVLDAGLNWAFCDTDSLAVAKPNGMSHSDFVDIVIGITDRFSVLSPYRNETRLIKIEDVNKPPEPSSGMGLKAETHRGYAPLFGLPISAKRYALFNIDGDKEPVLRDVSQHALGYLRAPYEDAELPFDRGKWAALEGEIDGRRWVKDTWLCIIRHHLAGKRGFVDFSKLPGLQKYAASRYALNSPSTLDWFKAYNQGKRRQDQIGPSNFGLAGHSIAPGHPGRILWDMDENPDAKRRRAKLKPPKLVAPFQKDPEKAVWIDRANKGVSIPRQDLPDYLRTYADVLRDYDRGKESKFLDGGRDDRGWTRRRHIVPISVRLIGKEGNMIDEIDALGIGDQTIEYGEAGDGGASRQMVLDAIKLAGRYGRRMIAGISGLSLQTIANAIRDWNSASSTTRRKLVAAAIQLREQMRARFELDRQCVEWIRETKEWKKRDQLATMLGANKTTISLVLSGKRPPTRRMVLKFQHSKRGARFADYDQSPASPVDLDGFDPVRFRGKIRIIKRLSSLAR